MIPCKVLAVLITSATLLLVAILVATCGLCVLYTSSPAQLATPKPNDIPAITTTPAPEPTPDYVMCKDYTKITDRYKTPNGFYIVVGNETIVSDKAQYENISVGGYVKLKYNKYGGWYSYDYNPGRIISDYLKELIPVTESESGYRMACKGVR